MLKNGGADQRGRGVRGGEERNVTGSRYQLLDSGEGRKLEQVGPWRLVRPAMSAVWRPSLSRAEWDAADGLYERDGGGDGHWVWRRPVPESWAVTWGGLNLRVKPTGFGHLGFFAEQFRNWNFFSETLRRFGNGAAALNLFAYSGAGSMAMAAGGAAVCHLDAACGMLEWGRQNLALNAGLQGTIRWIADDVMRFCRREIRRGRRYRLIAMDPPTFGRGSSGQVWKIERDLPELLHLCRELIDSSQPHCVTLSCHTPGFSVLMLERLLRQIFGGGGELISGEMSIPETDGRELPAGVSVSMLRR